jgi:anti-sigma factor ChrR (cupin superfamily)
MSAKPEKHAAHDAELLSLYALESLPSSEVPALEAHLSVCAQCQEELKALQSVVGTFGSWPRDILRPPQSLRRRLTERLAAETGVVGDVTAADTWHEPEWEDVAPGIACKILSTDAERDRVTMLVRLAPGADYPPHTHAGVEELHLLDGELWIDDRKLYPGDYNHAEPGTADARVWSETGCTCVLITSSRDELR